MSADELPDYSPSDPAVAARWRRILEASGVSVVRARLARTAPEPLGGLAIGGEHITKGFIERWLFEQQATLEQEERRRYRVIVTWTAVAAVAGIVAAVAGIIAAWPVVKDW